MASSLWHSVGRLGSVLLCLLGILIVALVVLPIRLDITAYKGPIERLLTDIIGSSTTVSRIHLRPSLRPVLTLEDLEIEGHEERLAPTFAAVGRVEVEVSLLPLLRKQIRLRRLHASDIVVAAQRRQARRGNWPRPSELSWQIAELANVELRRIAVRIDDYQIGETDLEVDLLRARIGRKQPLDLTLRGRLEGAPLELSVAGPTLIALSPRASDFPLRVELDLSDLHLAIDGTASRQPDGIRFRLAVAAASEGMGFLQPLTGIELAAIGGLELTAMLSNRRELIEADGLRGRLGTSALSGRLALDRQGPRPAIEGRILLERLDLETWRAALRPLAGSPASTLDLSVLADFDSDVDVEIRKVEGLAAEMIDLSIGLDLEQGTLTAPATGEVNGIPVAATMVVDASGQVPQLSLTGRIESVRLAQLDPWIDLESDLTGTLSTLAVEASTRGGTVDELVAELAVVLEVGTARLVLGNEAVDTAVELTLEHTRVTHRTDRPLRLSSRGRFLESPFRIEARTASLNRMRGQSLWPIDLRLEGPGATVAVVGQVQPTNGVVDVELAATGDRLSDLENWLGVSAAATMPFQLQGRLRATPETRHLDLESSRIGRTRFSGSFRWSRDDATGPATIDLHAESLDLEELGRIFDRVARADSKAEALRIDLPLLPAEVSFPDADLELEVDRLRRATVDLTRLDAAFTFRNGKLAPSPFSFQYGDHGVFQGQIVLDLEGEMPSFALSLTAEGSELGRILEGEGIVDRSPITATSLELEIDARGSTVRQMLRSSAISARFDDVRWRVPLPGSERKAEVVFDRVRLVGPRNQPIVVEAGGLLDQHPVRARLQLGAPSEGGEGDSTSIPVQLNLELASTDFDLRGEVHLPVAAGSMQLVARAAGDDLSTLSPVLGRSLPAIGPYRLDARLGLEKDALRLADVNLRVGESSARGDLVLERRDGRPSLEARFESPLLRTADLLPSSELQDEATSPKQAAGVAAASQGEPSGFGLDLLARLDALLALEVATLEVRGQSMPGLSLDARVENGGLDVHLVQSGENHGNAEIRAGLQPAHGRTYDGALSAHWNRRPYGAFSDILGIASAKGSWSVSIDLSSRGSSLEELLDGLDGWVAFTDYPADFKATILDLWGGSLVTSILPVFRLGRESRLNCTVGRFRVEQGVMIPEVLTLDSTRSRVRGKGTIDLGADRIELTLKPRPKQRNLINLATPVVISGTVSDPSIKVSKGGLAVTWFRFSLWAYTVWRDLLRKPLPADGGDVCVEPPQRAPPLAGEPKSEEQAVSLRFRQNPSDSPTAR